MKLWPWARRMTKTTTITEVEDRPVKNKDLDKMKLWQNETNERLQVLEAEVDVKLRKKREEEQE